MGKKTKRVRGRPDSIDLFDTEGLIKSRRYAQEGLKDPEIADKFGIGRSTLLRLKARNDDPRGPKLKRFIDMGRYHVGDPLGEGFLWIYDELERVDEVIENDFGLVLGERLPFLHQVMIVGDIRFPIHTCDLSWTRICKLYNTSVLLSSSLHGFDSNYLHKVLIRCDVENPHHILNLMDESRHLMSLLNEVADLNHKALSSQTRSRSKQYQMYKPPFIGDSRPEAFKMAPERSDNLNERIDMTLDFTNTAEIKEASMTTDERDELESMFKESDRWWRRTVDNFRNLITQKVETDILRYEAKKSS